MIFVKKKKIINFSIAIIFIIAIIFGILFYSKLSNLKFGTDNKKEKQRVENLLKEKNNLILKVSEIYNFPDAEEPVIATVSDPSSLINKLPFNNSKIGDKVLFFSKAGRVVLYRPEINKIIDIATVKKSD